MIRATVDFYDLERETHVRINDAWEASAEREEKLVGIGYAKKVDEPKYDKKPSKKKAGTDEGDKTE